MEWGTVNEETGWFPNHIIKKEMSNKDWDVEWLTDVVMGNNPSIHMCAATNCRKPLKKGEDCTCGCEFKDIHPSFAGVFPDKEAYLEAILSINPTLKREELIEKEDDEA